MCFSAQCLFDLDGGFVVVVVLLLSSGFFFTIL